MTAALADRTRVDDDGANDQLGAGDLPRVGITVDLVATLALTAYSVAVAVGFSRVFPDWEFLNDLVLVAAVGHGGSLILRRLRVPPLAAIPLLLVALTWLVAWIYYPDTLSGFAPLGDTWRAAQADFRLATDEFQSTTAPVPYTGGWAFLAGAITAATVWLSDTFAFRAHARGEALVPGAVLFVFIAALGVDEHRIATSLAVIGAGFCALALLRARLERRPRTVLGTARHPLVVTLPAAAAAAALVMGGAWAIGPKLPGAGEEPLFDTRGTGGGETEVVSPLVDIRSRLVNQAETELFNVRANAASYWRVSALPQFDGDRWDLPDGGLDNLDDSGNAPLPGSERNDQVVTVIELRGALVPAAPEPMTARGPNAHYNALTSSVIKTESELDEGDSYEISSAMPRFSPDVLRQATSASPPDAIFLQLPDSLPDEVAATAAEVTAAGATAFDKLVLLQDWFRDNFTYSTDVPDGNGASAISSFLEHRIGYCEQFSATYAAMARTLGLPSRVAVGFTQGEQLGDGSYLVRGRNAHAWPEVWFDGLGWVPFEPTPGRGQPGAQAYTGVEPSQEVAPQPETPTTTTTTTLPPTTTTVAGQEGQAPPPPTAAPPTTAPPPVPPPDADADPGRSFPWLLVLAVVAAVAFVLALPALVRRWRRRRVGPATDPAHMLLELWDRALAALAAIGFRPNPALTPLEVSADAAETFPSVAEPLQRLAGAATSASYAPPDAVAAIAAADRADHHAGRHDTPHDWCTYVEAAVEASLTTGERIKRYFTVWH